MTAHCSFAFLFYFDTNFNEAIVSTDITVWFVSKCLHVLDTSFTMNMFSIILQKVWLMH